MFPTDRKSNSANGPLSYHPSTTAPTEMVYCGPLLSLPASPPESPVVAWSDDQAREMADAIAAMKMGPTLPSRFSSAETLLGNPPPTPSPCPNCTAKSFSQVATAFAQQVVEALKSVNAKQEPPPPPKPLSPGHDDESAEPKARASTLGFKKVNEVYVYPKHSPTLPLISYSWDKKEYKYRVVESLTPAAEVNELDHYIFVVRTRMGKHPSLDPNLRS